MHQCRGCMRYLGPPWGVYELESKELLAVLLKKINGLRKVKLVDANWIWTEPHSRRLKVKLTVQKEVMNQAVLQQSFVVEFIVRNQQCPECQAAFANASWKAQVQVRQRVGHKRTFLYLEQLLLKHNAHRHCLSIQAYRDGMDFFYAERNQAAQLVDFLQSAVPVQVKRSKKLVSADNHSNIFHHKYTTMVDMVPICKDDVIILPRPLSRNLSEISQLCLVQRVSSSMQLVDPLSCQRAELSTEKYWRHAFQPVLSSSSLVEYVVLSSEPIESTQHAAAPQPRRKKYGSHRGPVKTRGPRLAEVEVARESDLGVNDKRTVCITHLGHLLQPGDAVMGYDISTANIPDDLLSNLKKDLPDVVLVRKVYTKGHAERAWKLRQLEVDFKEEAKPREEEQEAADYECFLQELEGDREMRKQVNLYRAKLKPASAQKEGADAETSAQDGVDMDQDQSEDPEKIALEELLEDFTLNDADAPPDDTGESKDLVLGDKSLPTPTFNFL
eukprot:CAMPEP_0113941440 /NCGR_PEP_ID=MMETSP1339-20121228/7345_1 /TAXON_ID=94617 /ORGANISM="Fibrocapsa japonica" /LENGTH=499 /DNA_ID=CAMNT_0000945581 /DNA_START=128 /DNA_END=1627 /DNA_ORIENTATION=+ /assembly_acc=CAM_ASM_000762